MLKKIFLPLLFACFVCFTNSLAANAALVDNSLRVAILNNDLAAVQSAIDKGADVNFVQSDYTDNPLSLAISGKNLPIIKFLLQKGANPNIYTNGNGIINSTPLLQAIILQDATLVKLLVDAGANVNTPSHRYYKPELRELSPLMQAIVANFTRDSVIIFDYLLSKGADVNYTTSDGHSVLMITVVEKYSRFKTEELYDMAEKLLTRGASQKFRNTSGENVMDLALRNDYQQIASLLKQKRFNQ